MVSEIIYRNIFLNSSYLWGASYDIVTKRLICEMLTTEQDKYSRPRQNLFIKTPSWSSSSPYTFLSTQLSILHLFIFFYNSCDDECTVFQNNSFWSWILFLSYGIKNLIPWSGIHISPKIFFGGWGVIIYNYNSGTQPQDRKINYRFESQRDLNVNLTLLS